MKPIYLNPAGRRMLGIPMDRSVGEIKIEECYPEELREFALKTILEGMVKDGFWSGETYFRHFETNEKIPVHDTHFLIKDSENGKPIGHATITRNMTREWQLQRDLDGEKSQLMKASKLATLGQMAAGIAHEINNPLAVIDGALSIVQKGTSDPAVARKLDMIHKSKERIATIVKGLKKFSRQSDDIQRSVFFLRSLVQESIELLQPKIKKMKAKIENNIPNDLKVYADEVQVEQILVNLISNAIDANQSESDAWVKIDAAKSDDFIEVSVQDSGRGISEELVENIFNPFFTTKMVGAGTGLGLSIAKGIATEHGGDLVYSKVDGHTTFILKQPVGVV